MASKIKRSEWIILYVITGLIDVFQISIDLLFTEFVAAPELVNELIDAGMGVGMLVYFPIRGVAVFSHIGRFASMLGMEVLTDITGGAASLWILEVWYMHKTVRKEEAEEAVLEEEQAALAVGAAQRPLYGEVDGVATRLPEIARSSVKQKARNLLDNIRPPNGGLNPAV